MKMVIAVRKDLGLSWGKFGTQVAHAAVGAALAHPSWAAVLLWKNQGQKKVLVRVDSEEALLILEESAFKLGLTSYLVRDHGRTELDPDTATAIAIGPADPEDLDPLTGPLKLYR